MSERMNVTSRGRLVVCIDDTTAPTEQDWDNYVALCQRVATEEGQLRIIVYASTGAPNAAQRRSHTEMVKKVEDARMVVIAKSPVLRGAVTAANWIGHPARAYSPDRQPEAFAHLGLDDAELKFVEQRLAESKHPQRDQISNA